LRRKREEYRTVSARVIEMMACSECYEVLDIASDTFEVVKKVDPFVQEHISFDLVAAAELDQLPDLIVGGFSGIEILVGMVVVPGARKIDFIDSPCCDRPFYQRQIVVIGDRQSQLMVFHGFVLCVLFLVRLELSREP
jgi:hypothetical protein